MCQLLSQVSLGWHLIKCVNCTCLNWQLKIQILMFGSKIGVTNMSKRLKRLNRQLSLMQMQNALQTLFF